MKQIIIFLAFLCLYTFSSHGQAIKSKPLVSIRVDSTAGPTMLKQCSRATPKHISGYWNVSQSDIDELERNFSKIDSLTAKDCCVIGAKIKNRKDYGFQYIGIVIKKKKYIYINAFPQGDIETAKKYNHDFDPTKTPIIVCDGGESFWGALFDIENKTFSMLSFNGYA